MPHRTSSGSTGSRRSGSWLVSLEKRGIVEIGLDPTVSRTKLVRRTPTGREARAEYFELSEVIKERWRERFGEAVVT